MPNKMSPHNKLVAELVETAHIAADKAHKLKRESGENFTLAATLMEKAVRMCPGSTALLQKQESGFYRADTKPETKEQRETILPMVNLWTWWQRDAAKIKTVGVGII